MKEQFIRMQEKRMDTVCNVSVLMDQRSFKDSGLDIRQYLEACRTLTLSGPRQIGKTIAALQLFTEMPDSLFVSMNNKSREAEINDFGRIKWDLGDLVNQIVTAEELHNSIKSGKEDPFARIKNIFIDDGINTFQLFRHNLYKYLAKNNRHDVKIFMI